QSELIAQKLLHAALIHHQHDHVRGRSADLKSYAAALHAYRPRSAPAEAIVLAAFGKAASILTADYKCTLLQTGNDDHALGFRQQVLGNAFVRCRHHFLEDIRRRGQTLRRGFGRGNGCDRQEQRCFECELFHCSPLPALSRFALAPPVCANTRAVEKSTAPSRSRLSKAVLKLRPLMSRDRK